MASTTAVDFVNLANGNAINGFGAGGDDHSYKLTAGSPGHNAASDGTDIGVNFVALDAALGGAVSAGLSGTAALSGKGTLQ